MENKMSAEAVSLSALKSKKVFLIFCAAFLSCVMLVGIIFGSIAIAKNRRSVMSYKGIYMPTGVANYLSSSYKYEFMTMLSTYGIESYDYDLFWQSEVDDGNTWGDILKEGTERYLKRVLIGNYLFDKNTKLSKDDKAVIEKTVDEILAYRVDGGREGFDKMAEEMGFTYRDFEKAVEMLYKYEMSETVVFGYNGAALSGGSFDTECDEYYESEYSKVLLMIIRTDGRYVTDHETGKPVFSEYDSETKAKIAAEIAEIGELVYNAENCRDSAVAQMNPERFADLIVQDYPVGNVNDTEGYYFSSESAYTLQYAKGSHDIVELALTLEEGHYARCELSYGVCFIYKCELDPGAYTRSTLTHFFGDFYENAASYLYDKSLDTYLGDVTVKDRYDPANVIAIPYSYELDVKFG